MYAGVNPSLPAISIFIMPDPDVADDSRWQSRQGYSYSLTKRLGEHGSEAAYDYELNIRMKISIRQNYPLAKKQVIF